MTDFRVDSNAFLISWSRKIRDTFKVLLEESRLMTFIDTFKNGLWPDGKLKPPGVPRTLDEKERTRDEANRKLSALMPGTNLYTSWMWVDHCHCRFGCQHDRKVKCTERCSQDLRGFAEPKAEPTHRVHHHRRGNLSLRLALM